MPNSMKQFIVRKLKENVPLSEIKKDLREKGYAIEEISKAVREAISGVDKKMSNTTIIQIAVLVVGVVIAIGVGIYFTSGYRTSEESTPTSVQNQTELDLIEKRKSEVGQPSILLQGTPEEIECSKYIPSSLLNLPLQNYSTKYSIDGSKKDSVWKSPSQPNDVFSLTNLPEVFYVYEQLQLVGCGYSQVGLNEQLRYPEGWKSYNCDGTNFEVKEQDVNNLNLISMQSNSGLLKFVILDSSVSLSNMGCRNE